MATADVTPNDPLLAHIQCISNNQISTNGVYGFLFKTISIVSATPGQIVAHLPIAPHHLNSRNSIHGSVTAALVDWAGSLSICTHFGGLEKTGPSTDMQIAFIGTAGLGEVLEVVGETMRVGSSLAFTEVRVRKFAEGEGMEGKGEWVARGSHTKYVKRTMDELKAKKAEAEKEKEK